MDNDGFIFILGRKDDVIILENGKKINPFSIENKIKTNSNIDHAIVFSQDKLKVKAIINYSNKLEIKDVYQWISKVNNGLSTYEKINSVYLTSEPFSIENGLLTSTLKIKRKSILEKYSKEKFEPISV